MDLFCKYFVIDKPIRLVELFAGIGAQAMALRDCGAKFEHHRVVEFDKYAMRSYNAIHGTNFEPTDIRDVTATDLGIVDTDQYCYILTYSFPCQSLSVAGKRDGMSKGSGTTSSLLWEVERLLQELANQENLPQVLLMENVIQVHSLKHVDDFRAWIRFLNRLGYTSVYQDLNAKDYGIPQSRNRCFMVSILGDYRYSFPEPCGCSNSMRYYLEEEVDHKFYLNSTKAQKLIEDMCAKGITDINQVTPVLAKTLGTELLRQTEIASTILARDYKGLNNRESNVVVCPTEEVSQ